MMYKLRCKRYWRRWERAQKDPEYIQLKAALDELEPRYEALLASLPQEEQMLLDRYITLRENINRMVSEFF